MKKLFVALCAVAMLALGACQKEDLQPQNSSDHPTPSTPTNPPDNPDRPDQPEPPLVQGEGIFNPGAHIVTVKFEGENTEAWTWSNGKLTKITPYENGALNEANSITVSYEGDRVKQINESIGTMTLSYNGDEITSAVVSAAGVDVLSATVTERANNKIRKISVGMSGDIINQYIYLFSGMGMKSNSKLSCDTVSAEVTLNWQGDNVSRIELVANATVTSTLSELAQIPQIAALIEGNSVAQMAIATMGSLPIPVSLLLHDTVDYTYDQNLNPYYWFLGDNLRDFSRLSKANMLSMVAHTSATLTLPESIAEALQNVPSSITLPLPGRSAQFGYEYNSKGFPTKAYTDEGEVEYIYEQ